MYGGLYSIHCVSDCIVFTCVIFDIYILVSLAVFTCACYITVWLFISVFNIPCHYFLCIFHWINIVTSANGCFDLLSSPTAIAACSFKTNNSNLELCHHILSICHQTIPAFRFILTPTTVRPSSSSWPQTFAFKFVSSSNIFMPSSTSLSKFPLPSNSSFFRIYI